MYPTISFNVLKIPAISTMRIYGLKRPKKVREYSISHFQSHRGARFQGWGAVTCSWLSLTIIIIITILLLISLLFFMFYSILLLYYIILYYVLAFSVSSLQSLVFRLGVGYRIDRSFASTRGPGSTITNTTHDTITQHMNMNIFCLTQCYKLSQSHLHQSETSNQPLVTSNQLTKPIVRISSANTSLTFYKDSIRLGIPQRLVTPEYRPRKRLYIQTYSQTIYNCQFIYM